MKFLRGSWEYLVAAVLICATWVTHQPLFAVLLCGCFLFACRRTNRG